VSPEFFKHFGPVVDGFQALAVEAVKALASFLPHGDEADFFENAQVLGDHRLRPAEVMDEAIDGHFAVGEYFEHAAALGLGDGVEGSRVVGARGISFCSRRGTIFRYGNMSRAFFYFFELPFRYVFCMLLRA